MIGFIVVGVAVSAARPTRVTPYYVLNELRERAEAAACGRRLLVIKAPRRRRPRRGSKQHTLTQPTRRKRREKKTFESRNLKVINMIAIHSRVW